MLCGVNRSLCVGVLTVIYGPLFNSSFQFECFYTFVCARLLKAKFFAKLEIIFFSFTLDNDVIQNGQTVSSLREDCKIDCLRTVLFVGVFK